MMTNKCLIISLMALGITFSTQITQAVGADNVNNNDVSLLATAWPLVMIIAIVFLLRKHFIPQKSDSPQPKAPIDQPATPAAHNPVDSQEKASPNVVQPVQSPKPIPVATQKTSTTQAKKPTTQAKTSTTQAKKPTTSGNIDLKDGGSQCQASTAKGDRCKRKTNLENASVRVNGKTYDITACKQHNNKSLQIFAKLLS